MIIQYILLGALFTIIGLALCTGIVYALLLFSIWLNGDIIKRKLRVIKNRKPS